MDGIGHSRLGSTFSSWCRDGVECNEPRARCGAGVDRPIRPIKDIPAESRSAHPAIGTDVNGVKTDLDATKGSLQQLRGEHGELIARNHEELEQLRRMGERDYFEFTLSGKGQKQHVGSMQVELRGASAKKHQYTVALYLDDMRLEKKNKSINEPIYFYANGSRQPMELVVNKISNKAITGYLSAPKAVAASAKAATN